MKPSETETALHGAVYRELFRSLTVDDDRYSATYASAIDLPRPLARGIVHALSLLTIGPLLHGEHDLADQVSAAMAGWFVSLWVEFQRSEAEWESDLPPLPRGEALDSTALLHALSHLERLRPAYSDHWKRLRRSTERLRDASEEELRIGLRALTVEAESLSTRSTRERFEADQERALRQVITPLADHLNETVPELVALHREIRSLFGKPARWELFDTGRRTIDLERLRTGVDLYEREPGLQRLVELIGHGSPGETISFADRSSGARSALPEPTATADAEEKRPRRDRSLSTPLPSEIALLADEDASLLFYQRWIDGGVLSLGSGRERPGAKRSEAPLRMGDAGKEGRSRIGPTGRSPVMLCIDTSGSMRGLPERVAEAFSLGMIRTAFAVRRPFVILVFQNGLREIAWHPDENDGPTDSPRRALTAPLRIPEALLVDLTMMLHRQLAGGTDTTPTLDRALSLVDRPVGDPVDLVLISDITTPKITPEHLNRIYHLQHHRRLRFHAVTINRNPMSDPLNVFDHRWHYRDAAPPHTGIDIESIRGVYLTT